MAISPIILVLSVVNVVFITLSQTALWQRKEYRVDRMRAFLASPESKPQRNVFWYTALDLLILAWVSRFLAYEMVAVVIGTASMVSILIGYLVRAFRVGVSRPVMTARSVVVMCIALVIIAFALLFMTDVLYVALFVSISPAVIALAVGIVAIPAVLKKKQTINRATHLRVNLRQLTTVGITGSVGKTSTKKYLVHILGGESEEVMATSEHRNSPYVVAQDMISRLSTKTKTYIAEMGAYRKGEIAELAQLVRPSIGVLTAVTNQHVALFGSIEELVKTKWELAEAIPDNGTVILNRDDATLCEQAKQIHTKIIWFSLEEDADVSMKNIILEKDATLCTLTINGHSREVRLPVITRGQLTPVLASVATAYALGVFAEDIIAKLETLPQLERTVQVRTGKQGALIVDDSYSASEASVRNVIDYLKNISAKDPRLVLVPIIELGSESASVHERIGMLLANLDAHVYIYGMAHQEDILRGFQGENYERVTWYEDPKKMARDISSGISKDSLIVLEGRVPSIIREAVL